MSTKVRTMEIKRAFTEHEKKLLEQLLPHEWELVIRVCKDHPTLQVEEAIAQLRAAGM